MNVFNWLRPELVVPLLAGHVLADFTFQPDGMAGNKDRHGVRAAHVVIVVLLTFVLLGYPKTWWWLFPLLGISHFALDTFKWRLEGFLPDDPGSWWGWNGKLLIFVVDQFAHLAVIGTLVYPQSPFAFPANMVSGSGLWVGIFGKAYVSFLVAVTGFVMATQVSGCFLGLFLKRFEQEPEGGLPKGGYWIGLLERALIFIFVLVGKPTGIGFLVAAKSIFRFGEMKEKEDRKLAEYILIGTLASVATAMIIAYGTTKMLCLLP